MAIGIGGPMGGIGGYGGYGGYGSIGGGGDMNVAPGRKSSPAECETCKNRKYKDGSDENVSFKSATHISPQSSGAAVRAHEGEHVSNAYSKAAEKGGRVLSVGVSIHTAVCPECGRVYTAGGTTTSLISYPKDDPYSKQKDALGKILNTGLNADMEA